MRTEQTLEWLKKGFVNTFFAQPHDVAKYINKMCFGDGDVTIVKVDKQDYKIILRVTSLPIIREQYDRKFIISYTENASFFYKLPYKITNIEEIL